MDKKWTDPLVGDQRPNPILHHSTVDVGGIAVPTVSDLKQIFTTGRHSLQTWGRLSGIKNGRDPHWIGVFLPTPLHTDPGYPRVTHHLVLRADHGMVLRGQNKVETPVSRGTYVVVDTHSPHQLTGPKGAEWYVGVSIDSPMPLTEKVVLPRLLEYASRWSVLTPDITHKV